MTVHIRPIHFCALCMYFLCENLCAVCIGTMKGTSGRVSTGGILSIFLSRQGMILFHFHLADCPRSLDSIAHLYNVGGVNISNVMKHLLYQCLNRLYFSVNKTGCIRPS